MADAPGASNGFKSVPGVSFTTVLLEFEHRDLEMTGNSAPGGLVGSAGTERVFSILTGGRGRARRVWTWRIVSR